jgi:hypothetical protein
MTTVKRIGYALATLLTVSMLALLGATSQPTAAQDNEYCFPETGHCIFGTIRTYWEQHGGLPVFGYPVTDVRMEQLGDWRGPTQWFERDRLEDHGPQGVMAGRLGAYLLQLQGRSWHTFEQVASAPASCRYFPETQHSLCEPFLSYWQNNGGLERFGYPITEPFFETVNNNWSGTVQYFERRRMELHPELPGSPILLGLLGNEVLAALAEPQPTATPEPGTTPTPEPDATPSAACVDDIAPRLQDAYNAVNFATELGCPISEATSSVDAATQHMENGIMIWLERRTSSYTPDDAQRHIFAVIYPGPTFRYYTDTWDADDDPYVPDLSAPSGYHVPRGGFGKVWEEDLDLRYEIGWAIEAEEREQRATVQDFQHGIIIEIHGLDTIFVFGDADEPAQAAVVSQ